MSSTLPNWLGWNSGKELLRLEFSLQLKYTDDEEVALANTGK
jgi:hypothetical protein